MAKKVIILGAAGRDFHNFNTLFRENENYEVVCFTAEQIPGIANKTYPKELSGKHYPNGIPIYPESRIPELVKKYNVEEIILSYSDLPNQEVMNKASLVNSCGADFKLLSAPHTMLKSKKKVISVCAVRTGSGKSQTTRKIASILKKAGKRFVIVRHPMPYGELKEQTIQRFETLEDLNKQKCTIEEREEYEHHILNGTIVYAGIDYEAILREAEKEAEIILWDGGNNDTPFYKPDLNIVVADPLRPGHEFTYYPGQTNIRMADVIVINKENSALQNNIDLIVSNIKNVNPGAVIIHADSVLEVENGERLSGKRVVVVEDGPTLTHGGMSYGAGFKIAQKFGAEMIDVRKYATGSIKEVYGKYPHLDRILPAMGYFKEQLQELEEIINKAKPDFVLTGTPIDLNLVLKINIPIIHVKYSLEEKNIKLEKILKEKGFI